MRLLLALAPVRGLALAQMEIIRDSLSQSSPGFSRIALNADRAALMKRRWRGRAEDGTEFGFDLDHLLADGDVFFENEGVSYFIVQKPEPVLELRISIAQFQKASDFARLGWMIGNLHFSLALSEDTVLVPDDPALRQLFEREGIAFTPCERVFKPLSGGHSHGHGHH